MMDSVQQIDHCLRGDKRNMDLYYKLRLDDPYKQHGRVTFSGLTDQDYPRHEQIGAPIFNHSWHYSFPQELLDQFKHMQSNFATGLLPSIMRAWMAIDSDLYLWNFENNRDLAFYDAINNTILHVAIAPPKAGFTYPSLHSILVVVTTVDILLLALSFQDSQGHLLPSECADLCNATLMVVGGAPLYRLSLDGLSINGICTTQNGRIFFSADDSLYELDYFGKGWFGSGGSCKKTNHSKRLLNYLVPVLQIFYSKDTISQLAIDDTRHLLYVLTKNGCIQLFDLGPDGRSVQKFGALYREQIEHIAKEACNVDPEQIRQIAQITPVPTNQSINVNLIATTSKGARIYISCLANPVAECEDVSQELLRPTLLKVLHIRFPSVSSPTMHPLTIYSAHQTQDCMLMASSEAESDTSLMLAHSSSCFAFATQLREHIVQQKIKGSVWDVVHLRPKKREISSTLNNELSLGVEQHICPLEKFFVITSKGIHVFEHCSPLEVFRRVLSLHGNDSKQFQALTGVLPVAELCAMALIVLCSESAADQPIKDTALRVFFIYGGEPRLGYGFADYPADAQRPGTNDGYVGGDGHMNGTLSHNASLFIPRTPLRTSTPQNGGGALHQNGHTLHQYSLTPGALDVADQSIVAGAQIIPSARHEALHSFTARIVKGIWRRNLCATQKSNSVYSPLTRMEVEQVARHLNSLRSVIDEHQLASGSAPPSHLLHHQLAHNQPPQRSKQNGAENNLGDQERQSLQKLRTMIGMTCEVLALWIVLLEHEVNVIFVMLSPDVQQKLLNWKLVDLVRGSSEVCADLITALVRFYIGDDASTTAISERLRQLCPNLFTVDDASVVRATESIYRAKASSQPRPEMVAEAISQLRKSIHRLNLVQTCDLLLQILQFEGIVELALSRAKKDDPNELALIAYKKHIGAADGAVNGAMCKRQEAYSCINEILRLLHTLATSHGGHSALAQLQLGQSMFPSSDSLRAQLSSAQAELERDKVIRKVLDSDDELASIAVFRWMLGHGLQDQLIKSKSKYFDAFLFHEIEEGKDSAYMELLWKWHDHNGNYLEEAKVLTKMASKNTWLNIDKRITYLSQASMCIQSAPETKSNAELRQSIQDKLDVAYIQLRTKSLLESDASEEVTAMRGLRDTLETLGNKLCTLTELYQIANSFRSHEMKLAVLHCAGKYEKEIVKGIWRELLQKELRNFATSRSTQDSMQKCLSSTLLRLRKRYSSSPQFVPLDFILRELLLFCFKHAVPLQWLIKVCKESEVPYSKLLAVASEQYRLHDPFWKQNARAFNFMLELAMAITDTCRDEVTRQRMSKTDLRVLKNTCLEFLAALQLTVQQQPFISQTEAVRRGAGVVERLEMLQTQIEKIL